MRQFCYTALIINILVFIFCLWAFNAQAHWYADEITAGPQTNFWTFSQEMESREPDVKIKHVPKVWVNHRLDESIFSTEVGSLRPSAVDFCETGFFDYNAAFHVESVDYTTNVTVGWITVGTPEPFLWTNTLVTVATNGYAEYSLVGSCDLSNWAGIGSVLATNITKTQFIEAGKPWLELEQEKQRVSIYPEVPREFLIIKERWVAAHGEYPSPAWEDVEVDKWFRQDGAADHHFNPYRLIYWLGTNVKDIRVVTERNSYELLLRIHYNTYEDPEFIHWHTSSYHITTELQFTFTSQIVPEKATVYYYE